MNEQEIEKILTQLKNKISMLRVEYDQFFARVQKKPPVVLEKDVHDTIKRMNHEAPRFSKTEYRFLLETLEASFVSLQKYVSKMIGKSEMILAEDKDHVLQKAYFDYLKKDLEKPIPFDQFKHVILEHITKLKLAMNDQHAEFDVRVVDGKIKIKQIK